MFYFIGHTGLLLFGHCVLLGWWLLEYLIDVNGITSQLFWEFFHMRWKILFCVWKGAYERAKWEGQGEARQEQGPDGGLGETGAGSDGAEVGRWKWQPDREGVGNGAYLVSIIPIWYPIPCLAPHPYLEPHPHLAPYTLSSVPSISGIPSQIQGHSGRTGLHETTLTWNSSLLDIGHCVLFYWYTRMDLSLLIVFNQWILLSHFNTKIKIFHFLHLIPSSLI